jgi:hypothetical protein
MMNTSGENIKSHVAGVLEGLRLAGVHNLSSLRQAVSVFNLPSSVRLSLLANLAVDLSEIPDADVQAPPIAPVNASRKSLSPSKDGSSPSSAFKRPVTSSSSSSSNSTGSTLSNSASTSSYAAGAASRHLPAIFNAHGVDSTYHYFDERKRSPPTKGGITSSIEPITSPTVASLRIGLSPASSASPGRMALLERARREAARMVAQRQMDGDDLRNDAVTPGSSLRPSSSPSERIHAVIQAGTVLSTPSYLSSSTAPQPSTITPLRAPDFTSAVHQPIHTHTEATQTETTTHIEEAKQIGTSTTAIHAEENSNAVNTHVNNSKPEPDLVTSSTSSVSSTTAEAEPATATIQSSSVLVSETIPSILPSSHLSADHPVASDEEIPSQAEPVPIPAQAETISSSENVSNEPTTSTVEASSVHSAETTSVHSAESSNPPTSTPPELPAPTPTPESERERISVPVMQTLSNSSTQEESLSSVVGVTEVEMPSTAASQPAAPSQSQEGVVLLSSDSQAPASPTPTVASSGRSSPSKSGYLNILEVSNEPALATSAAATTINSTPSTTASVVNEVIAPSTSEPQKEPTPLQKAKLSNVASKFGGSVGATTANPAAGPRPAIGARPAAGAPIAPGGVKPSMGFGNPAAEAEKRAKAEKEAKKAAEEKKLAEVKARQDKEKADKAEKERIETERKAKVAADKLAAEKAAAEKAASQKEAMYKAAVEKAKLAALEKKGLTPEQARAQLAATTAKEEAEKKAKADKEAAAATAAAAAAAAVEVTSAADASSSTVPAAVAVFDPVAIVKDNVVSVEAVVPIVASAPAVASVPAPVPAPAPLPETRTATDSKAPSVSASVAGSVVSTAENLATTLQISDHGPGFWYKHMSRNEMKTEAIRRGLDVKSIEDNSGEGKGAKTKALRAVFKSDDSAKGHDAYDSFSRDLLVATMIHRNLMSVDDSSPVEALKAALRKHDEDNSHKAQGLDENHE